MQMRVNATATQWAAALTSGLPITTGGLLAAGEPGYGFTPRDLPAEWLRLYRGRAPDYVVVSYGRVIAWHVPRDLARCRSERWVVPDVDYGDHNVARHQRLILRAVKINSGAFAPGSLLTHIDPTTHRSFV